MARLAIRATGDRSKRESVTTGDKYIRVSVIDSGHYVGALYIYRGYVLYEDMHSNVHRYDTLHADGCTLPQKHTGTCRSETHSA